MKIAFCLLILSCLPMVVDASSSALKGDSVVLENDYLRAVISPIGARVVSLTDKVRGGEQVKMLAHVGGLAEVRFNGVINHNDLKDRYKLSYAPDAEDGPTVTAVTLAPPTAANPVAARVTKRFTLLSDSGRIRCQVILENTGDVEFALIPWVRHLIMRGLAAMPEEAHMTPYGAFLFGRPVPGRPDLSPSQDHHHFPAAAWTTRVTLPATQTSNTLASILEPTDMLKIYNWHRGQEDFATQEFIAAPLFLKSGSTDGFTYEIIVTAPIRNIVYASPELIVGASPHPTGIAKGTRELTLTFGSAAEADAFDVHAVLYSVDSPGNPVMQSTFSVESIDPTSRRTHALPIRFPAERNHVLRLELSRAGQPWLPGSALNDREPILIPLVVGDPITKQQVFAPKAGGQARLLKVQPVDHTAPRLLADPGLSVFSTETAHRLGKQDRFKPAPNADATLYAARNEYESTQLVITPGPDAPAQIAVKGIDLTGPDGYTVTCESINQLLEVKTTMPSRYDAKYPVGIYREGLLPTDTLNLVGEVNVPFVATYHVPEDAPPGRYEGHITLSADERTWHVPIVMEVWNITYPKRHPWMDTPASLKGMGTGGVIVRGEDGSPLNRAQLMDAIVDKHLKYRVTPCDAGVSQLLLGMDFESFENEMQRYVDAGATKIFLGNASRILDAQGDQFPKIEAYLESKGWQDYFYVRTGYDEASPDLLDRIAEVARRWGEVSRIPVMETYYHDHPEPLFGKLDIYCRGVADDPWILQRMAAGDAFWRVNAFPAFVEREPWTIRHRYVRMFDYRFTGTYMWTIKQWHNINKWYEDFWADGGVGNLSATLIWPHETGLLSSIGLESLRDAIEDNLLFWLLREKLESRPTAVTPAQKQALADATAICIDRRVSDQIKTSDDLLRLRQRAGNALSILNSIE